MNSLPEKYAEIIKMKAKKFGFQSCGISRAGFLEEDAKPLENWLKNNHHGEMSYMQNHFDKRLNPTLLVEGSKSVISLSYNYFPEKNLSEFVDLKISKYAYGEDYHELIKEILQEMVLELKEEIGDFDCRVFTDSAPILERSWARKSGLGWVGKNANLITKQNGSFYFLAEIICDLVLQEDYSTTDHCGTCTKCIEACPTDAIISEKIIDGSKCISYFTIELKEMLIPEEMKNKFDGWMFGCDVCQDVCPWNKFSVLHTEPAFKASSDLLRISSSDWQEITQETFSRVFSKSAVKRTKFTGLKRNIEFLKGF
jgi:epoxyqueuosine reductase